MQGPAGERRTDSLTLYPDPTETPMYLVKGDGCNGVSPQGHDNRAFTVPAAGKLTVSLKSPDPTNKKVTDWDMYLMDSAGLLIVAGNGSTSDEQATATFKKKTTFSLQVCNLAGSTTGTVSWVFKYA